VNPSSKLLIAAALVAGGYGLATLLGSPNPPYVSGWSSGTASLLPAGVDPRSGGASVVGGMRLVPEPSTVEPAYNDHTSAPPRALATNMGRALAAADSVGASQPSDRLPRGTPAPRARLGDVLPARPSGPDAMTVSTPSDGQSTQGPATQVTSVSLNPVVGTPSAQQASFDWPAEVKAPAPALVPVDLPGNEPAAVQIHVVIDGDSLARLAGRYLDDPHRGAEIYRLNRDVLQSPDLLPIGAELKIPVGQQADQERKELSDSRVGAVDVPPQQGLVPVRAATDATVAAPRARLLRPLPAH
jgi:hypothetical protein